MFLELCSMFLVNTSKVKERKGVSWESEKSTHTSDLLGLICSIDWPCYASSCHAEAQIHTSHVSRSFQWGQPAARCFLLAPRGATYIQPWVLGHAPALLWWLACAGQAPLLLLHRPAARQTTVWTGFTTKWHFFSVMARKQKTDRNSLKSKKFRTGREFKF